MEKKLPDNIEQFWRVPSIIAEDGIEHRFTHYLVHSETGDIWSCYIGDYKKPSRDCNGYMLTGLQTDNAYMLHTTQQRIVLASKLQSWEPLELQESHHCNGVRHDNRPINLEPRSRLQQFDEQTRGNQSIAKRGENSHTAKLTEQDVRDIRLGALSAPSIGEYKIQLASSYNVHHQTIYAIIKGYTWTHVELLEPLG